jgi:hypothetical protein
MEPSYELAMTRSSQSLRLQIPRFTDWVDTERKESQILP